MELYGAKVEDGTTHDKVTIFKQLRLCELSVRALVLACWGAKLPANWPAPKTSRIRMDSHTSWVEVGTLRSVRIAFGDCRNWPSLQIMADSPSRCSFDVRANHVHHGIVIV